MKFVFNYTRVTNRAESIVAGSLIISSSFNHEFVVKRYSSHYTWINTKLYHYNRKAMLRLEDKPRSKLKSFLNFSIIRYQWDPWSKANSHGIG